MEATGDVLRQLVPVLAVLFTVVYAWPQVVRALRHGVEGVAVGAIALSVLASSAWLGYGIAHRLPPVVISNLGVLAGQLVVLTLLARHRAVEPWKAVLCAVGGLALVVASQLDPLTTPIVVAAGTLALSSALTQLVRAVRDPHELEGLSAGTYALLTILTLFWIAYAVLVGDVIMLVANLIMLPIATSVAWLAWRAHREKAPERQRDPVPTGPRSA